MNKKNALNISNELLTKREKELIKSWHPDIDLDLIIGIEDKGNIRVVNLENGKNRAIPSCTKKEALERVQKEDVIADIFG